MSWPNCLAAVFIAAIAVPALAHGGGHKPPPPPPTPPPKMPSPGDGTPSGPAVPAGTADPATAITRWETWWAANKDQFMRLAEAMRTDDSPVTRGAGGVARPVETAAERAKKREEHEAAVRDAITGVLLEALHDSSFDVRASAAIALGKAGSPQALKPLQELAGSDKNKDVRDYAVVGLGLLGHPGSIPFLDGALGDGEASKRHRSFAAFALGLIGGEDAGAALMSFADGKPGKSATFLNEPPELIASTYVAMGLTGDLRVLPTLRDALANTKLDENVRAFVMLSLGRMKDRGSLGDIGRILALEKAVGLRRSAAVALGRIADASDEFAVTVLFEALADGGDPITKHFAAMSLGGFADPAISKRITAMLPDANAIDRPFLALALALGKDANAAPLLRAALEKERDESVKASYCVALALLGDLEAAPLLEKQVKDRGLIWLQGYAAIGLGMLHHHPSAEMLRQRLDAENDTRLRANLAVALGLLHDPGAKAYFVATLRNDGTLYERGGAAMAMGVLRMDEAVMEIVDVYRNKKEQDLIRAFCVVALGLIADTSPIPKLARFSIDNNYSLTIDPLNEVLSIL